MEEEHRQHAVAIDTAEGGGLALGQTYEPEDECQEKQQHACRNQSKGQNHRRIVLEFCKELLEHIASSVIMEKAAAACAGCRCFAACFREASELHGTADCFENQKEIPAAQLEKLSTPEIRLNVIHSSAGAINESDVTLAAADGNAILIGFNVRPTPKAKLLAEQEKVDIRKYNIIYKCVEEITAAMEGMLKPDTKEEVTGQVEVRNTFKVPKVGVIAGCYVTEGVVKRTSSVNLIRDGIVKFTGKISSLKRFKDDAKEVTYGFECGIGLENWQDIQEGDVLEVFEYVEIARKLGDSIAKEKEAAAQAASESSSESAED